MRGQLIALRQDNARAAAGRATPDRSAPISAVTISAPAIRSRGRILKALELFGRNVARRTSSSIDDLHAPRQTAKRLADAGEPAFGHDNIAQPPARAARHRIDAAAELAATARHRRPRQQRNGKQRLARRVVRSLREAARAPSSTFVCRPSQRQMPKMSRKVSTTLVHISAGWCVVAPTAIQHECSEGEDDEAVAGDPRTEVCRRHRGGDDRRDRRNPGNDVSHAAAMRGLPR